MLPQFIQQEIVNEYSNNLVPMARIADRYGITRQGVWKIINRAGVNTSKRKLSVQCHHCGETVKRNKSRLRVNRHNFCGQECYYSWVHGRSRYKPSDYGRRTARKVVSRYTTLQPGQVVHHINGDNTDNGVDNLMVFACNGDHVSYHRGGSVDPVWDGAKQMRG